jgi:DNA end-binding protein Ku
MARAIWSGTIAFGMVSIPVGLSPATESKDVSFNQIHQVCNSRIKQKKFCPVCDRDVEASEIVKGYEFSKGSYVLMEEGDFENLPVASMRRIEVTAFVQGDMIDPIYYDKTYYLNPSDAGRKPFVLLLKALQSKNVKAVAKIGFRSKEHLCVLRATDDSVVLETLFYPDEIRKLETSFKEAEIDERELAMAEGLIDLLYEDFEPGKYKDAYRDALLERITAKQQGGTFVNVAVPEQEEKVYNLMDALRASLEAAKQQKLG